MGSALAQFKARMESTEQKYKKDLQKKEETHQKLMSQTESSFKASLQSEQKKFDALKKIHEQEVADIFEDERTLSFIKNMRGFKQQWQKDHAVSKRKATAAHMADATKKWVSGAEGPK